MGPHFEFSSPPPSPTHGRPRSSTVGAMPDTEMMDRVKARQEKEKQKKEAERRRASESPMKHMYEGYIMIFFLRNL